MEAISLGRWEGRMLNDKFDWCERIWKWPAGSLAGLVGSIPLHEGLAPKNRRERLCPGILVLYPAPSGQNWTNKHVIFITQKRHYQLSDSHGLGSDKLTRVTVRHAFYALFVFVTQPSHLIPVKLAVSLILLTLLLKGEDNESDENVDEEKRKHYDKENVEESDLDLVIDYRSLVNLSGVDRLLHKTENRRKSTHFRRLSFTRKGGGILKPYRKWLLFTRILFFLGRRLKKGEILKASTLYYKCDSRDWYLFSGLVLVVADVIIGKTLVHSSRRNDTTACKMCTN